MVEMDEAGYGYGDFGYGLDDITGSSFQSFDDTITGNDPASYDGLSNFQSFDDVLTDNQGYGWDTNSGDGTVWATGDPSVDVNNFGY
jgi:hypothetical protein